MKVTGIELLQMIKDGKIKVDQKLIRLTDNKDIVILDSCKDLIWENNGKYLSSHSIMNYEFEIIEEVKGIEKITIRDNGTLGFPNGVWATRNIDIAFSYKINELIEHINKLESDKK